MHFWTAVLLCRHGRQSTAGVESLFILCQELWNYRHSEEYWRYGNNCILQLKDRGVLYSSIGDMAQLGLIEESRSIGGHIVFFSVVDMESTKYGGYGREAMEQGIRFLRHTSPFSPLDLQQK